MDETIGAKGGQNDRRRSLKIKEMKQKRLQESQEIKELERDVKRKQRFVLIKVLPIAIAGGTLKTLYETAKGTTQDSFTEPSREVSKEYEIDGTRNVREEASKTSDSHPKTREVVVVLEDGKKVTVEVPIERNAENLSFLHPSKDEAVSQKGYFVIPDEVSKTSEASSHFGTRQEESSEIDMNSLDERARNTLQKLKSRKIITEYERQLKEVRYELRQLVFEYDVLVEEEESILFQKEAEILLERLSDVIRKIEVLKEKIQIDSIEQYDDNYIYTLIEDYMKEFRDKRFVEEMKDSPLYVLISEKLDEIDHKKDDFEKKVEDKREQLAEKEDRLEELKEKYYQFDRINNELLEFQYEQDQILREVQEKVRNAVSVQEKVEVQVVAMNRQSRRLLRLMTLSMFLPGNRSARSLAASTAAYLYFARNVIRPKTVNRKVRVIHVKDYRRDIERNLHSIEEATDLLNKTDKQVDRMIQEIRRDFGDYIGVLSECDELLANLEKVKSDLHEKEYEMEKVKAEQQALYEKNHAKVLSRGEYPM